MNVFLLDNYDSFTYNIVHLVQSLGENPLVLRNTDVSVKILNEFSPERIIISPGPMRPGDHRFIHTLIKLYHGRVPILGICLGMQAINVYFGGKIEKASVPVHGKTSKIFHDRKKIFRGLPSPFTAARYHSLVVSDIPPALEVIARSASGEPMALAHSDEPVFGVQFHPESYLSSCGKKLMKNFLEIR